VDAGPFAVAEGMTLAALTLAPAWTTPGAVLLCVLLSFATMGLGCSIGVHRLLIHRSFSTAPGMERALAYLAALAGAGGPIESVRMHELRDWSQRQAACHDLSAHRAWFPRDFWWQLHCRLELTRPPCFQPEARLVGDPFLRWLDATWMWQQLPLALCLAWLGGMPWVVWGVPVRVAVSQAMIWLTAHLTHRRGPRGWVVDGMAVQGHDRPALALLTFGEAWHDNHHAWPGSARFGLEPGQFDPGWWLLLAMRRLRLVWDLKQPADLQPRAGLRRVSREPQRSSQ
jgi:fatty-acid desaturase